MLVLRNKMFSSQDQDDKKLTNGEKAAVATATVGAGVAGFGQKYLNKKKREWIKSEGEYLAKEGIFEPTATDLAKDFWKIKRESSSSNKDLRKETEFIKKHLIEPQKAKNAKGVRYWENEIKGNKILLERNKGKLVRNPGIAATVAGLGYLGYSKHKKHKKKD